MVIDSVTNMGSNKSINAVPSTKKTLDVINEVNQPLSQLSSDIEYSSISSPKAGSRVVSSLAGSRVVEEQKSIQKKPII